MLSSRLTHPLAQSIVDPDEGVIQRPLVKVVPDRVPVREVRREEPPLAAGTSQVEQGVYHLPEIDDGRPTRTPIPHNQRADQIPLLIGEIGRIAALRECSCGHRGTF